MNARVAPSPPLGLRARVQRALARALPTWTNPGPVTAGGIYTQDSGYLPNCLDLNYWQEGWRGTYAPECAAVEACVGAYAQTAAMLPGTHWRKLSNGGRERVDQSPLARVLHRPNPYQTRSDFILNIVRALYFRGNAYALAERDERDAIVALHPLMPTACAAYVAPDGSEVFYSIAPTDLTPRDDGGLWPYDPQRMVPARDVWHVRLHTPRSPLTGETPLAAASLAIAANMGISAQQQVFASNMSRPSGVLSTPATLTVEQMTQLRAAWNQQSAGINAGGVPILSQGLEWKPLSMTAADAQLIQFYKLSIADIARVMRVPLPLIGESDATFANTETLMQFWVASGLGFLLEHLETSLDALFALPSDEYCELDTAALLRSNFKERIEAVVRGVQGGVFTPNEGRNTEGLPSVEGGDEPRMQQQVVPLTYWERELELKEQAAKNPPPAASPAAPAPHAPVVPPGDTAANDDAAQARQALLTTIRSLDTRAAQDAVRHAGELAAVRAEFEVLQQAVDERIDEAVRDAVAEAIDRMTRRVDQRVADLSDRSVAALERAAAVRDGEQGPPGPVGPEGREGSLSQVVAHEPGAIYRAGDFVALPADHATGWAIARADADTYDLPGEPGAPWTPYVWHGRRGPAGLRWCGEHRAGEFYREGDAVRSESGAAWIRTAPGTSVGLPGDGWELLVKQGPTGGRGKMGERGPAGVGVAALEVDDAQLVVTLTDGSAQRLPLPVVYLETRP